MTPPTHHALEELLGAYALDAVDDEEAETVELHLRECARCRATVAEFRDTASYLAAGRSPAPVAVWDSIVALLEGGDDGPLDRPTILPPRRRWRPRYLAMVAAAAVVLLVAGLSVQVVSQRQRLHDMETALEDDAILAAALAAEDDPDALQAELRSADGVVLARAVLTPDGTGFLRASALRSLPADRTYQLWAVIGTERISAGVLGPRPDVVPFRIAGEVIALAVTEEDAGGVVASQNEAVATGLLAEA